MTYALCDCNNFFVSCERLFRPDLEGKPVIVLSGNDGCVVSRSNEAKALGIPMGAPFYQIRAFAEKNHITPFSSNLTLYADISRRIMSLLSKHTPCLLQYSIDEAYLHFDHIPLQQRKPYLEQVVHQIRQCVGIPVSFGIAPTKTLAKVATRYAKRYHAYHGVCAIDSEQKRLKALQGCHIDDVWGIGHKAQARLHAAGINSALEFAQRPPIFAQNLLHKPGLLTWQELNSIDCICDNQRPQKQSISHTRTFAHPVSDLHTIERLLTDYLDHCALQLRRQHSLCASLTFFVHTSRFDQQGMFAISQTLPLPVPTAITAEMTTHMLSALRLLWTPYPYKRAGVILNDITPDTTPQTILFDDRQRQRDMRLQQTIDHINQRFRTTPLRSATQLPDTPLNTRAAQPDANATPLDPQHAPAQPTSAQQPLTSESATPYQVAAFRTPSYTTSLADILTLKA